MTRSRPTLTAAALLVALTWTCRASDSLVFVEGGTFKHARSNFAGSEVRISDFYISRHEVTQREWMEVMGTNPSHFKGDDLPVEMVSWYDSIEYCNRRSLKEGLQPYYSIARGIKDPLNTCPTDDLKWIVTINPGANGYRLPTEAEWEYAASGGQQSRNLTYSGSDDLNEVGWFWQNSGNAPLEGLWNWPAIEQNGARTHPVGQKKPNELGLYDMSGNVREWCWDWMGEPAREGTDPRGSPHGEARVWKGGGWMGGDFCCEPSFRSQFEPPGVGSDQGLRVCRAP